MSVTLSRPRMAVPRSAIAPPAPEHLDAHLAAAVRDAAVRATVAVGLGALAAIHAVDAVAKWTETRYVFWMYMAAIVAAVVVAAAVVLTRSRASLLAGAAIAGSVLLGYVVNRTIGLPNATGDIGNWTEPLGLTSMVVEGLTIALALGGAALQRAPQAVGA